MSELLGLVLVSFFVTSFLLVPFIDFLFHVRRKYKKALTGPSEDYNQTYNRLIGDKDQYTPVGGGLLIIPVVVILSFLSILITTGEVNSKFLIIVFTILSFGCVGLLDDIRKIFADFKGIYPGLRGRYLIVLQVIFALIISILLYKVLGFNNIFIPVVGNVVLGWLFIPLSTFVIVSFSNACNIADGLDGLSTGLLTICLFAFLALASSVFDLTTVTFVGVWIGALIAYLYFNIYPARIFLGDAGAYGFGATLAVIGLLTGKILGLAVIGGVFVIIIATSLIQVVSKKYFKRKVFPIAPIHLYLRYLGWQEPKVVTRLWLAGAIFAIFGLWLSLLSK